jgi:two-component sensor histidine kinase
MLEPMSVVHSLPNKLLTSWGFYLVLSLLILLFLALRSARQLITPIQHLTEATKNLTQGELEQNVSVNTNDELETLAESFNEMTENLRLTIEEKDTLLKELHHRVKNNMQVVTSLLRLQSKQIDNPEVQEIFSKSRQRINSMALVHEQLYQSDTMTEIDVETYLNELVRGIKHGYLGERTISIECQVEEGITLDMDRTIHCGLIISELTLNALQHAFTEADTNSKITISLSQSEDHFVLTIGDNGSGLPDDFEIDNPSSLGMNLVHRLATKQLRGDLTFKTDNETVFTVEFPKNPTYTNSNPTGND